jgi:hypothetical protein
MADVGPVLITGAVTVFGWYATYAYAKMECSPFRLLTVGT